MRHRFKHLLLGSVVALLLSTPAAPARSPTFEVFVVDRSAFGGTGGIIEIRPFSGLQAVFSQGSPCAARRS